MAQRQSIIKEFIAFMGANKKWWLLPLILVMLVLVLILTCWLLPRLWRGVRRVFTAARKILHPAG